MQPHAGPCAPHPLPIPIYHSNPSVPYVPHPKGHGSLPTAANGMSQSGTTRLQNTVRYIDKIHACRICI